MDTTTRFDQDSRIVLHPLVYLADGEEITIGRRDIDSYGIFPPDGAEMVRRLAAGETPREVDLWYQREYGESADIDHVLGALAELDFIVDGGEITQLQRPINGQRLGAAMFSFPAMILYAVVISASLIAMARSPDLTPHYSNLFFTDYLTIIEAALAAGAVPLVLLHEAFHLLAARRLGIRSRIRVGRRLYYVVLETSLDGLVTVPRRQRYLPILAGILLDVLIFSLLTLIADLTRTPSGGLSATGRLCLALAFATLLRIAWQFFFYLRTDLYVLMSTLLGCVDLHTTAKRLLRNRLWRLTGRHDRLADEEQWHPIDRRVASWYSWLIVAGYTFSIAVFAFGVAPAVYLMFANAVGRLIGEPTTGELADSVVFLVLNLGQILLTVWLAVRERRQRRAQQFEHVIA
ncbi:hypothetical protein HCA58_22860 [Micromonospora sp. HNM0581]|uniref:hypothetical protein n=1 Tax=Micromonospora sp. HNM0581 TaxID=2716341 RepID=UPI00146A141E|nr:hypothetical protein [Micromonospora sp. HNM0581]